MTHHWQQLPPIAIPAPILALAAGNGELWASGPGGVAWHALGDIWTSRISGLPLSDVAALVYAGGWLVAGGVEGIARSSDGGRIWQAAIIQGSATHISALAASPNFARDTTMLAATFGAGIIRSEDAGRTWKATNFGLQTFDITALIWGDGERVLAGTSDGMYRSSNGGRAWRRCAGSEGEIVAALAFGHDAVAYAALESGVILQSRDHGETWELWSTLPTSIEPTGLHVAPDGSVVLGSTNGMIASADGAVWTTLADLAVYCMTSSDSVLFIGDATGTVHAWDITASHQGRQTLRTLGTPQLHDLRHLLVVDDGPLIWGTRAGAAHLHGERWQVLETIPLPLTTLVCDPTGALWAATPDGLFCSQNNGASWSSIDTGVEGIIAQISFRPNGVGWASSSDGTVCLYTPDAGATWEQRSSPFQALPLVALEAMDDAVVVGAYDSRRKTAQLWRSEDEGHTWERGAEIATDWPIVATWSDPPLLGLSGTLLLRDQSGEWERIVVGGSGNLIRRVAADGTTILVLTTTGLWRSSDRGRTWQRDDTGLPVAEAMDLALHGNSLFILLAGGKIWRGSY